VGLCGTDIHAFFGRQPFFSYPRILGHEIAVEVDAAGPGVEHLARGTRCAVEPYLGCGSCGACRGGKQNCCERIQVLGVHADGGLRPAFVVPADKLHPADDLSDEQLALVEPLVIGAHAVRRAAVQPDDVVLVVGAGPIGLAAAQAARAAGPRVVVLEREPLRRERLADFGLETAPGPGSTPQSTEAALVAGIGRLPSVVIDATGNADSMRRAFHYAAHGGRVVFVGLFRGEVSFDDPNFHKRELTLLASRNGTGSDFEWVIDGLRAERLDARPWVTHRFEPEEVPERIASLADPGTGCLKALVSYA
jgi:2-desacetyl-2-hydroxyethyl bacteriochlorophyllide A dehydrogenase